eukprot:g12779.t1
MLPSEATATQYQAQLQVLDLLNDMINGRVNKNEFIDLVKETFLLNDMRHITEADILRTVEHPENPLRAAGHVDNLFDKMSNGEWISSEPLLLVAQPGEKYGVLSGNHTAHALRRFLERNGRERAEQLRIQVDELAESDDTYILLSDRINDPQYVEVVRAVVRLSNAGRQWGTGAILGSWGCMTRAGFPFLSQFTAHASKQLELELEPGRLTCQSQSQSQ